jgi:hypothetical protein
VLVGKSDGVAKLLGCVPVGRSEGVAKLLGDFNPANACCNVGSVLPDRIWQYSCWAIAVKGSPLTPGAGGLDNPPSIATPFVGTLGE